MLKWWICASLIVLIALTGCAGNGSEVALAPTEPQVTEEPTPTATPTIEQLNEADPTLTPSPTEEATATPTEAVVTPSPTPTEAANTPDPTPTVGTPEPVQPDVEVVVTGLSIPWALAFAPDGRIFVTERAGRLRVIENGTLRREPIAELPVTHIGEGGLMGLELDPDFAVNGYLYLMYTYSEGSAILNRISRYTLSDDQLGEETILVDAIPGARFHNGGRLAIGPDGKLYATTGDALVPGLAQDLGSLAGKILRVNLDGTVPDDNPFGDSYVFSYGHRNPQGLTWQPETDVLFATEHGPSGEFGFCCRDELNRIVPGGNYGWPYVSGGDVVNPEQAAAHDIIDPVSSSGLDTWAPAGAAFYDGEPLAAWRGDLFFAGLRGAQLRRVVLGGQDLGQMVDEEVLFSGEFGRIREVIMGPDGYLYFTTSNRDGRGQPAAEDDRILRVVPGP